MVHGNMVEAINKSQVATNKETTIKDQDKIKEITIKETIKVIIKETIKEIIKDHINKETTNLGIIIKDHGKMVIILITMDNTDQIILDNIIMLLVQMDLEVYLTNQIKVHQEVKEVKEDMEEMVVMDPMVIV